MTQQCTGGKGKYIPRLQLTKATPEGETFALQLHDEGEFREFKDEVMPYLHERWEAAGRPARWNFLFVAFNGITWVYPYQTTQTAEGKPAEGEGGAL